MERRTSNIELRIRIRRLSKAYGVFWALREVDTEVLSGEIIALLGPNGAGKTTFLRLLSGLIQPTAGHVEFSVGGVSGGVDRSRVGFLVPGEHVYENLTVRENLAFFLRLYGRKPAGPEIERALSVAGLEQRTESHVSALSSGMKCRLAIAKWQLLDPALLLLDEPYGVLDGSGVDLLESFLKAQAEKGHTVIIASHHVARVTQICTRAIVLDQGSVIFDEARQQPWETFQRAFKRFLPHGDL